MVPSRQHPLCSWRGRGPKEPAAVRLREPGWPAVSMPLRRLYGAAETTGSGWGRLCLTWCPAQSEPGTCVPWSPRRARCSRWDSTSGHRPAKALQGSPERRLVWTTPARPLFLLMHPRPQRKIISLSPSQPLSTDSMNLKSSSSGAWADRCPRSSNTGVAACLP